MKYITIPKELTTISTRDKQGIALTYALIRSLIIDNSLKASYPISFLAVDSGLSESSIKRYLDKLDENRLITIDHKKGSGEYPYNVFHFPELKEGEYSVIYPDILFDSTLSPKLRGLLLLIKLNCIAGTNHLTYGTKEKLAEILHIGKNQLTQYLNELASKGYVRLIDKTLIITNDSFPLYLTENVSNTLYKTIYDYCLSKDTVPPYKQVDEHGEDKNLTMIAAQYPDEESLRGALNKRCPTLPKNVTLAYFCQALRGMKPNQETKEYEYIIDLHFK